MNRMYWLWVGDGSTCSWVVAGQHTAGSYRGTHYDLLGSGI
jgi:hypothetical protein